MAAPSKFLAALHSEAFVITCELDPPKGIDLEAMAAKAAVLKEKVQAVVVSDNPQARLHMAPWGFSRWLLDKGLEPVMTLTCRDRNRLALQSDLLAAASLGIKNILAVTGDYISWGDHPEAKPVYDLDSLQLIQMLGRLNANEDLKGAPLSGPSPEFAIGAAATLTANPVLPQVMKFNKKEQAGVQFFISHPIFDLNQVEPFFQKQPESKVPLLASVSLLSKEQIQDYRSGGNPGLTIPESLLEKYEPLSSAEVSKRSLEESAKLIEAIKNDGRFRGVHLILQGAEERIGEII
jgi:methylenetetrahydrofolate reductase (NADPH)